MQTIITKFVEDVFKEHGGFTTPIVDVGGAETQGQFKHLFSYEIWDKRNLPDVDRVIDITEPLERSAINYAAVLICVDTLEHIWEFQKAIKNLGRIVKQGGVLVITVPFAFPFHDISSDFWRFSSLALDRLFLEDFARLDSGFYGEDIRIGSWGAAHTNSFFIGRRR